MINIKKEIRPEEVRNEHILFVEGKDNEALDPIVLRTLFTNGSHEGKGIPNIQALGASFSIKSVAEALHPHHPTYYFLIDRDHYHPENVIDAYWNNFPNPETHNLLIWKRKELENYFLDSDFLLNSKYCNATKKKLESKIIMCCQERLFIDAANYVIISIREDLKNKWIETFTNPVDFSNKEVALEKLKNANAFEQHKCKTEQCVSLNNIEDKLNYYLNKMTGDQEKITFGKGEWLNMIYGKKVLTQVINSSFFKVPIKKGANLTHKEKLNAVIKDLLTQNDSILPPDFIQLRDIIRKRINES